MGCHQTKMSSDSMIGALDALDGQSGPDDLLSVSSSITARGTLPELLGEARSANGRWGRHEIRDIHADKVIVVLSGCLNITVGKDHHIVHDGETILIPQGVAASYDAAFGDEAKMILLTVPASL